MQCNRHLYVLGTYPLFECGRGVSAKTSLVTFFQLQPTPSPPTITESDLVDFESIANLDSKYFLEIGSVGRGSVVGMNRGEWAVAEKTMSQK